MPQTLKNPLQRLFAFFTPFLLLLLSLSLLTSCESNKTIVNDLDEKDANDILVFLDSKGISADKVKAESGGGGGSAAVKWNISVKSSESSEAMRLLNQQGLPRRATRTILDLYSSSGLVPSDVQETIKYHAALGEQLANTIRKYDGVLDADVQISFPKIDALNPEKTKGKITAAIWVKHSGVLDNPNSHLKSQIQRLVSSAITGLAYDDVTVIGERSRLAEESALGGALPHEEKHYVKTWGVVIAQESLFRFQILFFSFSLLILLLLLLLTALFWKLWPVLKSHGGIKALFSRTPLISEPPTTDTKESTPEKPEKAAKKESGKEDTAKVNKNIDET